MADELEIKMAQGAKPGEGGQLPGMKNNSIIASLRFTIGHHPDLAAAPPRHLQHRGPGPADLRPEDDQSQSRVGVKLVAEAGVGTIAAGVAKAYADYVLISGHDGDRRLAALLDQEHRLALGAWLSRDSAGAGDERPPGPITVRTDGGLKTGRDVVMAAMLGAEEYGFGTAAVVAIGCDMARACHINTCPTGRGDPGPEVPREVRRHGRDGGPLLHPPGAGGPRDPGIARFRKLDEVIGRPTCSSRAAAGRRAGRPAGLTPILTPADPSGTRPRIHVVNRNVRPSDTALDPEIIRDAQEALESGKRVSLHYTIQNAHRTVGARLAGEIARRYGSKGLPKGTIEMLQGSAARASVPGPPTACG